MLTFDNSSLNETVAMGISAGGQSIVLANWVNSNMSGDNLLLLNGNRSTLAFGGVKVGSQSQT